MKKDNIGDMIHLIEGNIADEQLLKQYHIDTIVNASRPSLMGISGENSVDGAIHQKIDNLLHDQNCTFKDKIRYELDVNSDTPENEIRCQRGKAVITKGYGLCNHVIHVVGTEADTTDTSKTNYSFCLVQKLSECYYDIVEIIKTHRDIENIAIPIISTGNYRFNYVYAFKIAVACMGNALIEWKTRDKEFFETSGLKNIYFIMYKINNINKQDCYAKFDKYQRKFKKNKKVVYQTSFQTHFQILKDIRCNDSSRGYFLIAKWTRYILLLLRTLFFPFYILKEFFGGDELFKRRCVVEILTILKAAFPILVYVYVTHTNMGIWKVNISMSLLMYFMMDTVTYLLALVLLSDVQSPSANIIRSMILFFVNYLEVILETSILYFMHSNYYLEDSISIQQALEFGILGERVSKNISGILLYVNAGTKFFFLTLVFGYLTVSLKPKKFKE